MLNIFRRKSARKLRVVADPNATRADLQIRNLLDNPRLRKAMALDIEVDLDPELDFVGDFELDSEFDSGGVLEPSAA